MDHSKYVLHSFFHSLGVLAYVLLVVWVINNAQQFFGSMNNQFWGPVAVLMLFVLSATIVGLLVLGRPVYLYLNGQKDEGLKFLFYTIGWLLVFTIIILGALAIKNWGQPRGPYIAPGG